MQNHLILLSGFFIAVILSRVIIPRILIISLRKRLFDALMSVRCTRNLSPVWA